MEFISDFDIEEVPIWKIAHIITSPLDYSMDRIIFVEDYPEDRKFTIIHGYHCSCYGFDDTDWEAFIIEQENILDIAQGWVESGTNEERALGELLIRDYGWMERV